MFYLLLLYPTFCLFVFFLFLIEQNPLLVAGQYRKDTDQQKMESIFLVKWIYLYESYILSIVLLIILLYDYSIIIIRKNTDW